MAGAEERSAKHEEARSSLREELKPIFDELAEHYRFWARARYGSPFVSYAVLSDLVRSGWRCSGVPEKTGAVRLLSEESGETESTEE